MTLMFHIITVHAYYEPEEMPAEDNINVIEQNSMKQQQFDEIHDQIPCHAALHHGCIGSCGDNLMCGPDPHDGCVCTISKL